ILPLQSPYLNSEPFNDQVYARVENNTSGCFTIVQLNLLVANTPILNAISDYVQIDIGNDGVEFFDLTNKIPEIVNSQTEVTVIFFETEIDAYNNENSIIDPAIYQNISNPQTIYVRLENDNTSCFSIGNFNLIVDASAGINDENTISFSIQPNPASEMIQIQSDSFSSETNVEVYNIQGQVVFSEVKNATTGSFTINVSDLASGMYFVQIQSEGKTVAKKLIKQ
ncbi:MAG: T9SS type A sorting domain-containing protein, partial [Flavobacteriaceae bacterium]|nr:T9SS type A sorting domain-containing protein [Flavobacteriaceae bacterium]